VKVSNVEGIANHNGPESCGGVREDGVEALTGEGTGWVLSREIGPLLRKQAAGTPGCRRSWNRRKATPSTPLSQGVLGPRAVADPTHVRKSTLYGNREIPRLSAEERTADRVGKPKAERQ